MILLSVDWSGMFELETSIPELLIRGTVLYVGILILMRLMPRRTGAELSLMDLIWVLLITEAASNAMGNYTSLQDGIILIVIYMAWDYLINILKQNSKTVERLLSSAPLLIVKDGQMLKRNMRKEFLSKEELLSNLREHGIEAISEIKKAYVEGEGVITAITFDNRKFTDGGPKKA